MLAATGADKKMFQEKNKTHQKMGAKGHLTLRYRMYMVGDRFWQRNTKQYLFNNHADNVGNHGEFSTLKGERQNYFFATKITFHHDCSIPKHFQTRNINWV